MAVERYYFSIVLDKNPKTVTQQALDAFRAREVVTNLQATGQAGLKQLWVGGEPQLAGEGGLVGGAHVDLYHFSTAAYIELRKAFMSAHGLKGDADIEEYCEKNNIDPPSLPVIDIPVIRRGTEVKVEWVKWHIPMNYNPVFSIRGTAA